tara:strand:- start:42 stop:578 length:537 start_codon:yes stop_codon:yes gene_type:complete
MPDYQKCMMYKLICDEDPTFLYIGHTTNWNRRKAKHKEDSLNDTRKAYQRIRELGGWENIKMIWIEDFPCNNKREGEAREQYWMDTLKSTMNSYKAFITEEELVEYKKEWYKANKEEIRETQKEHYENNKETIAARQNVKYNCECGGKYTYVNQPRHFRTKKHQDWLLTCHTAEDQVD